MSSLPFWCLGAKGGESVGFAGLVSSLVSLCFRSVEPSLLWFVGLWLCSCETRRLSYGVRHMHLSLSYCLLCLVVHELYDILCPLLYAHIHCLASMLSVIYIVARITLSIKYRGSVDPSMCAV